MARVTIYVPDDLRARMNTAGDEINWSDHAQRAFQHALATYEHRKAQTMDSRIEQLRASKKAYEAEQVEKGQRDGRDWVMHEETEYSDLLAVSRITPGTTNDPLAALMTALDMEDSGPDWGEFLEGWFDSDTAETIPEARVWAFIEAAQAAFAEVEAQL